MRRFTKVLGTGSALPKRRVSNQELAAELAVRGVETSDEWITTRSGIHFRHYAYAHERTSDLAATACNRAIEASGISKQEIDLVVVATSTPDHFGGFPSTASVLQKKLGIRNGGAAFDVQAVCTGFVYGLTVADSLMKTGTYRNAIVVGAEIFSQILDFDDRSTCVLFGDGAGAIVLGRGDNPGIYSTQLHSDGELSDILKIPGRLASGKIDGSPYLYMEGSTVFKSGVKAMADVIVSVMDENNLSVSELDWLIMHQANIRILKSVASHISLPTEKLIITVDRHANTSAASIPLALDTGIREGKIKPGNTVMMAAVGGGLTWGGALMKL